MHNRRKGTVSNYICADLVCLEQTVLLMLEQVTTEAVALLPLSLGVRRTSFAPAEHYCAAGQSEADTL